MSDSSPSRHPHGSPHIEPGIGDGPSPPPAIPRRSPKTLILRARSAWVIAGLAGIICFAALPPWLGWATRSIGAWDLAVLVLVGEAWFVILRSNPQRARDRAVAEDPGRAALLAVSFGASLVSLVAAVVMISNVQVMAPHAPDRLPQALGLVAIVGAWTLLHTAYTLHYAGLYYGEPDMDGGLEFRGGPPDDADFAYFAFGIGMTFEVPDVNVTNRQLRRVVLAHQLVSFAYNTAILALVVNLLAGRPTGR
jgi:uncharacterized membrane protein